MPPLVDIFLPHYQGAVFIEKAVGSLMAQTHEHWRLTMVDDASRAGGAQSIIGDFTATQGPVMRETGSQPHSPEFS